MAVTTAVTDLFASIYELAASVVGAVYTVVHSFVMGIVHLFAGFIGFFADIFKGVFDLVGGVGKFVTGEYIPHYHHHHLSLSPTICRFLPSFLPCLRPFQIPYPIIGDKETE